MVYGRPPFYHLNLVQKLHSITNPAFEIKYPAHPLLCPQLKNVLQSCLQRNPRHRPTVNELLKHAYLTPSKSITIEKKQVVSLLCQLQKVLPNDLLSNPALVDVSCVTNDV